VDVGPEFRRSKGLDVVGSLLSLFETKDVWVKQMQGVLTTKLLSAPTYEFPTEIRTVELLRLRFGDAWTQAYNVMLKDMQDSKRADALIRESQNMGQYYPEFHSKILSRMYWPQPTESSEKFRPPKPVAIAMKRYEKGFSQLKKKRLLSWDATKGQVDMQVELSDRVLRIDDATPAAAAVIYAFHTEDDPNAPLHDKPVTRTFTQLQESLEMSSPLLTESLRFLVSRTVLVESAPGEYTVLETRPSQSQAAQAAQHQRPAGENIEAIDRQKREEQFLVAQFIVGMLTNGGPMPMERIRGMLAMLVPGGFRWSSEQLLEFLGEMKEQRRIEPGVGGWRVVARQ
jgi:anaphase-promoting complex subunit 2